MTTLRRHRTPSYYQVRDKPVKLVRKLTNGRCLVEDITGHYVILDPDQYLRVNKLSRIPTAEDTVDAL